MSVNRQYTDSESDFKDNWLSIGEVIRRGSGGSFVHPALGDVPFRRGKVHHVYVITMVGTPFLKVGVSYKVTRRRAELRGPYELDIRYAREVGEQDFAYAVESYAHEILSNYNHKNEWFKCSVEEARFAINSAFLTLSRQRGEA